MLGEFELVYDKIVMVVVDCFVMESVIYYIVVLIDSGVEDFMVEIVMLKVFVSD